MRKFILTLTRAVLIDQERQKPDWKGFNREWKRWEKEVYPTLHVENLNSKEGKQMKWLSCSTHVHL